MRSEVLSATNFLCELMRLSKAKLSDSQLKKFQEYVCDSMCSHYKDHWFPEKPFKGSAYRCIRINGVLDPLITKASSRMGIPATDLHKLFPSELTMWIDPWEVSYRIGENGSICILYDQKPPSTIMDTPNSTPPTSPCPPKQQLGVMHRPQQPSSPLKMVPASSSPSLPLFQQQQIFSPSKSGVHNNMHILQQSSPGPIPIMDNSMINCKESLRGSMGLESIHGLPLERRLFVSS